MCLHCLIIGHIRYIFLYAWCFHLHVLHWECLWSSCNIINMQNEISLTPRPDQPECWRWTLWTTKPWCFRFLHLKKKKNIFYKLIHRYTSKHPASVHIGMVSWTQIRPSPGLNWILHEECPYKGQFRPGPALICAWETNRWSLQPSWFPPHLYRVQSSILKHYRKSLCS